MKELVRKYIDGKISDNAQLLILRDNPDFMIEVFRSHKIASDFDKASDRLKGDPGFIQKTKDVFASDRLEFFSLCILLRNWRKQKEKERLEEQAILKEQEEQAEISEDIVEEVKEEQKEKLEEKLEEEQKEKPAEKPKGKPKKKPKEISKERCVSKAKEECAEELVEETNISNFDDDVLLFENLVNELPIDDYSRLDIIDRYKEASEESRIVALAMVNDYVKYHNQEKPVGLMKLRRVNFNGFRSI